MDDTPRHSSWQLLLLALLALVTAAGAVGGWLGEVRRPGVPLDDSFMFLRYADQFLAGRGHAWNPDGVQTYGNTSLLYFLAVLVARATTGLGGGELLRTLSSGFGLLVVPLLILAGWRSFRAARVPGGAWLSTLLVCPFLLVNAVYLYQSRNGMDTTLTTLCIAGVGAASLWTARGGGRAALATTVVVAWLAWQARPDTLLMAGGVPFLMLALAGPDGRRGRLALTFGVVFGLLLGADALLKLWWFGVPLPLPVYAKTRGYEEYAGGGLWNTLDLFLDWFGLVLPCVVVMVLCAARRTGRQVLACILPAAATTVVLCCESQIMGYRGRFLVPATPLLVLGALLALQGMLGRVREGGGAPGGMPLRVAVSLCLLGLYPVARTHLPRWHQRRAIDSPRPTEREPSELPQVSYDDCVRNMGALARVLLAGTRLCMSEYGFVGAQNREVAILDPLGLHDLVTARTGFSARRLLEQEPDLIWMPHTDYVAIHRELRQAILESGEYDYYPGAFLYGVAVRRSGPHTEELTRQFDQIWGRVYPAHPMEQARAGD